LLAEEQGNPQGRGPTNTPFGDATAASLPGIFDEAFALQLPQGRLDRFGVHPQFPGKAVPAGEKSVPPPLFQIPPQVFGDLLGNAFRDEGHAPT
jgi:hypothetical protein